MTNTFINRFSNIAILKCIRQRRMTQDRNISRPSSPWRRHTRTRVKSGNVPSNPAWIVKEFRPLSLGSSTRQRDPVNVLAHRKFDSGQEKLWRRPARRHLPPMHLASILFIVLICISREMGRAKRGEYPTGEQGLISLPDILPLEAFADPAIGKDGG